MSVLDYSTDCAQLAQLKNMYFEHAVTHNYENIMKPKQIQRSLPIDPMSSYLSKEGGQTWDSES